MATGGQWREPLARQGDPAWDAAEAATLYDLLEWEVIPEFYARDKSGIRGRWHSQPGLHRSQCAGTGALSRIVSGSRIGPDRGTGSAHGRRPYPGTVPGGNRGSPANRSQPPLLTRGGAGEHDPETQHGASGIDLPHARYGR